MDDNFNTPETLQAAIEFFADLDNCHSYMVQMRWPDGVVTCPICNQANPRYLANQRRFECRKKHPKRQFSVKVGTIFEDSPITLKSWLLAVWMIANCKNGISSYELARAIGVTQKTAWFMNHRIRIAMQGADGGMLDGEVEVDEKYIGGKARNMNAQQRAKVLAGRGRKNAWAGKVAVLGYHAEKYVDGVVRTNGLENYWSLLKRTLKGTYVSVEPFRLFRYLDEQAFRFNERTDNDATRFSKTLAQVVGPVSPTRN